jgi:sec-independent protein translocase protein TatA
VAPSVAAVAGGMIGTGMFDIGLQELVVIFVIALLVFGPKNLPQLGRSLGRAMREFRKASDEFRSTIETRAEFNSSGIPTSATRKLPSGV